MWTTKKLKKVIKDGKEEEIKEKLEDIDIEIEYLHQESINHYTNNSDAEDILEVKKGDFFENNLEDYKVIAYVSDKGKVDLEDVKVDIVLEEGSEYIEETDKFLQHLHDKGVIQIKKDLREYLELDENKVNNTNK